jgi:O-antigen/teichoic acid export membrane protein
LLRTSIEEKLGWDHVGYWQAVLKLSDFVFSFIGLFIASTFLPRVASAKSPNEAFRRALDFAFPFTVLLAAGLVFIAFFGQHVLVAVYSEEYRFLSSELNILLFGSFFRALAWLSTFYLMARNHLKLFLAFEVLGSISLYVCCIVGLESGLSGLIWGQVIQSIFYLVILLLGIFYLRLTERI